MNPDSIPGQSDLDASTLDASPQTGPSIYIPSLQAIRSRRWGVFRRRRKRNRRQPNSPQLPLIPDGDSDAGHHEPQGEGHDK